MSLFYTEGDRGVSEFDCLFLRVKPLHWVPPMISDFENSKGQSIHTYKALVLPDGPTRIHPVPHRPA